MGRYGVVWVCCLCGKPEQVGCIHSGTEYYSLIRRKAYNEVQRMNKDAQIQSSADRIYQNRKQ